MSQDEEHTEDFIKIFQRGEEKAFDFYFRKYYSALCFFANGYLENTEEAKDLIQECFIKLWEKRQQFDHPESIKSFLYTIVRNRCIDALRRKKVSDKRKEQMMYFSNNNAWEPGELHAIIRAETIRQIYSAIDELPPKMQQVFRMYYIEGKKYGEIAAELNTSYDTVRQQKAKALTLLKEKLPPLIIANSFFLSKF